MAFWCRSFDIRNLPSPEKKEINDSFLQGPNVTPSCIFMGFPRFASVAQYAVQSRLELNNCPTVLLHLYMLKASVLRCHVIPIMWVHLISPYLLIFPYRIRTNNWLLSYNWHLPSSKEFRLGSAQPPMWLEYSFLCTLTVRRVYHLSRVQNFPGCLCTKFNELFAMVNHS